MVLAVPEPAAAAMTNLKILYQLGAALGSSFDVDQVLEVVMDLVFEHVKADRGIILLLDAKRASSFPRSSAPARTRQRPSRKRRRRRDNRRETDNAKPARKNPRLAHHHQPRPRTGEGVLSSNAMADRRFSKGKSVHNLGIRTRPVRAHQGPQARRQEAARKSSASSTSTAPSTTTPIPPTSFAC